MCPVSGTQYLMVIDFASSNFSNFLNFVQPYSKKLGGKRFSELRPITNIHDEARDCAIKH